MIAIGALGGSGTRVVAELISNAGVYIGKDLNTASDNLIFTRLFKDPHWYRSSSTQDRMARIRLFEKLMTNKTLSIEESIAYFRLANNNEYAPLGKLELLKCLIGSRSLPSPNGLWGFKEPNSHIYLKELYAFDTNIKYVHVIRHGLDMAFSPNLQQVHNWGFIYGIEPKANSIHSDQLDYWIKSNITAMEFGNKMGRSRFYQLNLSKLCSNPEEEIAQLFQFLDIQVSNEKLHLLAQLPVKPRTSGRYVNHGLHHFTEKQIQAVKSFGFEL